MLAGQRAGLVNQLAPERITEAGLDVLGTPRDERLTDAVTTVNHFAYGAAGGALYAVLTSRLRRRGVVPGMLFGLALFTASYEGWVPAVGILPPIHEAGWGRAVQLLVAHLLYGATLGAVVKLDAPPD